MEENKGNILRGVIISIVYPFAGLVNALRQIRSKEAAVCFFIFCVYFGFAFIYYDGSVMMGEGKDSERYAIEVMDAHKMDCSLSQYIDYRDREDYYATIMLYVVSRFTGNPQIFYGVVTLIMAFFMVKSSWIIISRTNKNKYVYLCIIAMLLSAPVWKISGLRWWTALYVFLYGLLSFIFEHKKLRLLWCLVSALIHFTFLFPVYVLLLWFVLPKRKILPYVIVFAVLSLIGSFDLSIFEDLVGKIIPSDYDSDVIAGYMTFEYGAKHNWFADSGRILSIYLNLFVVLCLFFNSRKTIENDDLLCKFTILVLLMASLCLFVNFAPWGRRFLDLSNFLLYGLFAIVLSKDTINKVVRKQMGIAAPFMIYYVLFQLHFGFYNIGALNLFLGNFITVFLYNDNIPIQFYIDRLF